MTEVGDGSVTANFAVTLPCCQWLLMGCWLVYTECLTLDLVDYYKYQLK